MLNPVLMALAEIRLGFSRHELMPMDHVGKVACPLLILYGEIDHYTPPSESVRLYRAAPRGTQHHEFQGAGHVDLYRHSPAEYESVVLPFLAEAFAK
jgi:fermentation-respiration switch protein FrsA (DUF1100 family)